MHVSLLLQFVMGSTPKWRRMTGLFRALWRWGLSARAPECQKLKMVGYTSMELNPKYSSNLEQLALKGLTVALLGIFIWVTAQGSGKRKFSSGVWTTKSPRS